MAAEKESLPFLETGINNDLSLYMINQIDKYNQKKLEPYAVFNANENMKDVKKIKELVWRDKDNKEVATANCILIGEKLDSKNNISRFKFWCLAEDDQDPNFDKKMKEIYEKLPEKIKNKVKNSVLEINEEGLNLVILKIQEIGKFELGMDINNYYFGCYNIVTKLDSSDLKKAESNAEAALLYSEAKKKLELEDENIGIEPTTKLLEIEEKYKKNLETFSKHHFNVVVNPDTKIIKKMFYSTNEKKEVGVKNIVLLGLIDEINNENKTKFTFSNYLGIAKKEDKDTAKKIFDKLPDEFKKHCSHGVIEFKHAYNFHLMSLKIMEQNNYDLVGKVGLFLIGVQKLENEVQ